MLYTEKVMDHFEHPRNVGEIENADGVGQVGNPKCGDIMKMYLKIDDGVITDVKFKTFAHHGTSVFHINFSGIFHINSFRIKKDFPHLSQRWTGRFYFFFRTSDSTD